MKALVCEMCGSQDMVKQDGLFVCQCCHTKYSVEEAKKLMLEGSVKIDRSGELENLIKAARNAREAEDADSALKHYEKINALDPDNWEAVFYLVALKAYSYKYGEIKSIAISVSNALPKVFELIDTSLSNDEDKKEATWEVLQECQSIAESLIYSSHDFYKSVTKGNGILSLTGVFGAVTGISSTLSEIDEDAERCVAAANIMFYCGNYISDIFDMNDGDFCYHAVWAWKNAINFHKEFQTVHKNRALFDDESVRRLTDYINEHSDNAISILEESDESKVSVLTVSFTSQAGGPGQLWYSIDGGEKQILNSKESVPHFLDNGEHTLTTLNPFNKKRYDFVLDGPKTINVLAKGLGMKFSEN